MRVASRGLKAALRASPRRPAWSAARPPPLAAAAGESAPRAAAAPPSSAAGAFSKLPVVPAADDHLASAVRRAGRVRADPKIKNDAARARHAAARRLDALAQALCTPVGAMTRAFPAVDALHPFDAALLTLTLGDGRYEKTLARVDAGRRAALQAGKDAAAAAAKARTKADAVAAQADGEAAVRAAWARGGGPALDALKEVAKALRRLPAVDAAAPVAALVGAPNVGKSSIVRALSSGVPEVNSYPFTTRSVAVGHFYVDGVKHQITDTPGLLARPDPDRNAMERLTLATVAHLPAVVLFVADAVGASGSSPAAQWSVRADLRAAAGPDAPWIDVLSKADLLAGAGLLEGREAAAASPPAVVETAADLVAALGPAAVAVCAATGEGIEALQAAVVAAFEQRKG